LFAGNGEEEEEDEEEEGENWTRASAIVSSAPLGLDDTEDLLPSVLDSDSD